MKKILIYFVAAITAVSLLTACGKNSEAEEIRKVQATAVPTAEIQNETTVRLAALTGPTAIGMAKIYKESSGGESSLNYSTMLAGSADEITPLLLQGEIDIASIPLNLASILYNKTEGGVTVLAADVLGVLYIGEYNGTEINGVADLKGKTIYATGKGSVPETYLKYILTANGIDPDKDVAIEWKSEPSEVVALLNAQQSGIAMLPQPYATAAANQLGEGYRTVISVSDEWDKLNTGSRCITACVVVRTEFLNEHPELVEKFTEELDGSINWVNNNPADAAVVCEELGISKAAIIEKAIPQCNIVCITDNEMKDAVSGCISVQFDFAPAMVGGALPGDDFYHVTEKQ